MAHRILHIDLDAFFVSAEQVLRPELKGKPVVVGGKPDRRGVVASASYEARKFGLHAGMPLSTAHRLCPRAIFIEGNFARYQEASAKFMTILADFSPFLEPTGLDEAYLDVTGFESLHGSIVEMAAKIKQRIKNDLGLPSSVGIASGKVVAKIAAEQSKPDGLLEVPAGGERAFLAPLPAGELPGIGKKSELRLKGLGIHSIGQIAGMSPETLKAYFGIAGVIMHRHANGIDDRPVEPPGEAKSISRETTFAEDTRDRRTLEAALRYLGERVGKSLRDQGRHARCIILKLRYADFTTITRRTTLKQASDTNQVIFAAGLKLLKIALGQEKQPVRLIGIGVSHFIEPARQSNMFDSSAIRQEKLDRAIDRIRRKYGFTSIQTGRTLPLQDIFDRRKEGYVLPTPSLSR